MCQDRVQPGAGREVCICVCVYMYVYVCGFGPGSSAAFRRVYEAPILASRQPGAPREVAALGEERGSELARLTKLFVLRRTAEVNNKYLPPKGKHRLPVLLNTLGPGSLDYIYNFL